MRQNSPDQQPDIEIHIRVSRQALYIIMRVVITIAMMGITSPAVIQHLA